MTDKDFGRKPKFGPVSKKGSLKPPSKNRTPAPEISPREISGADRLGSARRARGKYRVRDGIRRGGVNKTRPLRFGRLRPGGTKDAKVRRATR